MKVKLVNNKVDKCIVCNKNSVTYPWVCSECAEINHRKEKKARVSFGISFVFFIMVAALIYYQWSPVFLILIGLPVCIITIYFYQQMEKAAMHDPYKLTEYHKYRLEQLELYEKEKKDRRGF